MEGSEIISFLPGFLPNLMKPTSKYHPFFTIPWRLWVQPLPYFKRGRECNVERSWAGCGWQLLKVEPGWKGRLGRHLSQRRHPKKPYIWRNLLGATITSRNLWESSLSDDDKPVPPKSSAHETDNPQISLQSSGCSSLCFRFCQFTIHKEENFKPKLFCHESDCIGKIAVAIHRKIFFPGRK